MSGLFLTWLADELRGAGLDVVEYEDWQSRARSSGGFADYPLCVMWHHTASQTSPANDASYMCDGSSDRPIANILIARDGQVWVLAAGATNTNGKGNALTFSRGNVPADSMNTRALGCEIANSGVGEQYPQAQVDAMFVVNAIANAHFGNEPSDLSTHNLYAPTRKIDPATINVAGPWQPGSCTSSGTWSTDDIRAEALARTFDIPAPEPIPEEDDVKGYMARRARDGATFVVDPWLTNATSYDINSPAWGELWATGQYIDSGVNESMKFPDEVLDAIAR